MSGKTPALAESLFIVLTFSGRCKQEIILTLSFALMPGRHLLSHVRK